VPTLAVIPRSKVLASKGVEILASKKEGEQ
jgi:hypothetical protein